MKFFIKTYGCQMNERDSEAVTAMLGKVGHQPVTHEEDAEVLLFNTCSVREQAETKAIGKIGIMKRLKRKNPDLLIGVMGCMAQNLGERLTEEIPHVDFVVGTGQLHNLPEILANAIETRQRGIRLGHDPDVLDKMDAHTLEPGRVSAFVAVMRGCNRYCSYCIVPYVRGPEASRNPDDIVRESEILVGNGIREIMLLGQNVAAFGLDGNPPPLPPDVSPFAELLERLDRIEALERVRFTSPHPAYFNERLIQAIVQTPSVCDSIHLPLQSGSDAVLKRMNRPYSISQYLKIIRDLRSGLPDITFSTDIIVGFPGETEEDFLRTREAMEEVGFDNAYIFKYSPRSGTAAAVLADDVPREIKEERNQILLKDLEKRTLSHNRQWVGKTVEIMVEGPSKRNPDRWCGRTRQNKVVIFEPATDLTPGTLANMVIRRVTAMTLFA